MRGSKSSCAVATMDGMYLNICENEPTIWMGSFTSSLS